MGELRKETASPGGRPRGAGRGIVAPAPPGPRPTAPGGAVGETQAQAEARGSLASRRTTPALPAPAAAARGTDQGMDGWTDGRTDRRAEDRREGRARRPRPAHPEAGLVPRSEVGVVS